MKHLGAVQMVGALALAGAVLLASASGAAAADHRHHGGGGGGGHRGGVHNFHHFHHNHFHSFAFVGAGLGYGYYPYSSPYYPVYAPPPVYVSKDDCYQPLVPRSPGVADLFTCSGHYVGPIAVP